jgi:hypothetical protein
MKVEARCQRCKAVQTIDGEPRQLAALSCPACGNRAEARASEDFASAIEDALAQMAWLGRSFDIDVTLSTRTLPPPFRAVE